MQSTPRLFTPVLIVGCLIILVSFAVRASFGVFQIPIAEEFGWPRAEFSLAIAIQNLFWGIGQPIFGAVAERIGDRKVDSAKKTLTSLNPDVNVVTYDVRLGADNIMGILEGYDVIVDGADNFPSRYLLNDASVKLGIPVVHGSIFRFEGQVTVFDPKGGVTYRDMLPEAPPAEFAPSCAEAGVLGVLPGIVGSIQALEAIKLILGIGEGLSGRLVAFDALDMTFREYRLQRDPDQEVTWENRDRIQIAELDGLCMPHVSEPPAG